MISDVYFPRINGVSTSIQTFRRGLAAAGHDITLIAPEYAAGQSESPAEDDIVRVPARVVPRDPEDRLMRRRALARTAADLCRTRAYDIVHVQTPFIAHYRGVAVGRRHALPVVETYHTYFEEYLHHYVPILPRALTRLAARRFTVSQCSSLDALVVPSRAMRDALTGYGVDCPMQVIPTGMAMDRFCGGDGAAFRTRLGIAPQRPVLTHVGRIAHEKNLGFLLRMLAILLRREPRVLLVIAGEGPALSHLQRLAASLGLTEHVRFVGYLARDSELLDCYRAGDLFVFASRTETQGLVLLESLALGTPVVATAHMGTADILAPGLGSVTAPDDEERFAAAVAALLADPGRRQELAQQAVAYAATWSVERTTAQLADLYEQTADRYRSGSRALESSRVGTRARSPGVP